MEADIDAETLSEMFPVLEAEEGQTNVRLGRKLQANTTRGVSGCAPRNLVTFQHNNVSSSSFREVIGDAAPHDPRANNDEISSFHCRPSGHWISP